MIGTDNSILNKVNEEAKKKRSRGRPPINRELAYSLIKAGKSTRYITKVLGCKSRTIRKIKKEMLEKGMLKNILDLEETLEALRDFDKECADEIGYTFLQFLTTRRKNPKRAYNFVKKLWSGPLGKPPISVLKDREQKLADQVAIKFLELFGDDKKRIRERKKLFRMFFTFLGREDINDRFLTMTRSRDPIPIRELPQIAFKEFPKKLDECIERVKTIMGIEAELAIKLKIVTQMRTGQGERELYGIRVGKPEGSYIIMTGEEDPIMKIKAKGNEEWTINWIPKPVRRLLYQVYQLREVGDYLIKIPKETLIKNWRKVTREVLGFEMTLHDLRKVSITWLWAMGVPLEIATSLNVGWRDLNTPRDHYLNYRRIMSKEARLAYRAEIPEWFKEGLSNYID